MNSTIPGKDPLNRMIPANKFSRFQILVHVGSLTPLMWLRWDTISGGLTVNLIRELTQ